MPAIARVSKAFQGGWGQGQGGTRLADAILVVRLSIGSRMVAMSARVRSSSRGRRGASGGFSLIELMVVVIIIGIIAVMAIPTMVQARLDRNAYDDAGAIMQLFRNARTRAVARGGAVVITMTTSSSDRGTFQTWEAVTKNAGLNSAGVQAYQTPVSTCKAPTAWIPLNTAGNPGVQLIDGVNLNGAIEADANVWTTINSYGGNGSIGPNGTGGGTQLQIAAAWICFTPLGHVYFTTNVTTPTFGTTNPFDGVLPMVGPLELRVQRFPVGTNPTSGTAFGTTRSVLMPPNGMARIFSHT
jgi:type II secretion system protein H